MNIRARNVKLALGGNQILRGVDLDADERRFTGVIGPNGSGKSTLLKCVYRVLRPDGGAVFLDGENIAALTARQSARKLAVLSQHNYYNFEFTVREIVLMGRAPHKRMLERDTREDMAIVDDALEKVGMAAFANRSFSTLSGGEQQRIILARALAQRTRGLILDEPTNHLDIQYQLQLLELVRGLGVTVLAAFHDLNIAAMFCDRLYALQAGQVIAAGTPEEVLTPELIQRLYGVRAEVQRLPSGRVNIVYQPLRPRA